MDETTVRMYTLYRVVNDNPASDYDLMSFAERGTQPNRPLVGVEVEAWTGVSCWSRLSNAEKIAKRQRAAWIAELRVTDPPVRTKQLIGKPEHLTVFADVPTLRAAIVRYHRVRQGGNA